MELEKKVKMLQVAYAGVLVDSLRWYTKEGIFDKVTIAKREEQFVIGKQRVEQFSVSKPEQVFLRLSEFFNCANWEINKERERLLAETKTCLLCTIAKKFMTGSPCNIYCLDPMEGMVKAINPKLQFKVQRTLWDGDKCKVEVLDENID